MIIRTTLGLQANHAGLCWFCTSFSELRATRRMLRYRACARHGAAASPDRRAAKMPVRVPRRSQHQLLHPNQRGGTESLMTAAATGYSLHAAAVGSEITYRLFAVWPRVASRVAHSARRSRSRYVAMTDPIIERVELPLPQRDVARRAPQPRLHVLHAGSGAPVARLRLTGRDDRMEGLYWSLRKERWAVPPDP